MTLWAVLALLWAGAVIYVWRPGVGGKNDSDEIRVQQERARPEVVFFQTEKRGIVLGELDDGELRVHRQFDTLNATSGYRWARPEEVQHLSWPGDTRGGTR